MNDMDEQYYIIDKIPPYDSFYFGLLRIDSISHNYCFANVHITKKNINGCSICGRDLVSFSTAKIVSKLFHDSILMILHNTRNEIFYLRDDQDVVEDNPRIGGKFYFGNEKQLYIANPRSSNLYNGSLTIDLEDDYPMMRFDFLDHWMYSTNHTTYHLDDDVYDIIVQQIRQTIQI